MHNDCTSLAIRDTRVIPLQLLSMLVLVKPVAEALCLYNSVGCYPRLLIICEIDGSESLGFEQ